MISPLVKEKIGESIKNADIVQLKVLNKESFNNKYFFYKGFFIKLDNKNNIVSFYDVVKEKIILALEDIKEIVTITKAGGKLIPAWEIYKNANR